MAPSYSIIDKSGTYNYNLYTGTLKATPESWRSSVTNGLVTETISLAGGGTGAALVDAFDTLDFLRACVVRYATDPNEDNYVYLYQIVDAETEPKQTIILDMDIQPVNDPGITSLLENAGVKAILTIVHPDFWEEASTTLSQETNLDWTNPVTQLSNLKGHVDGRYDSTYIYWSAGTANRIWMGVRPRRASQGQLGGGTESPIMEIEGGQYDATNDTNVGSDSGGGAGDASPLGTTTNNLHTCNFTNHPEMARRTYFNLGQQFGATYNRMDYWAGKYHVLLRYRLGTSPATEVLVQLKYGLTGDATMGASRPVFLNTTSGPDWDLIEIGMMNIPTWGNYKYDQGTHSLDNIQVEIWAELVTGTQGTSTFDMDALILIPAEHFVYIENANMTTTGDQIDILTTIDGYTYAAQKSTAASPSEFDKTLILSKQNWYQPWGLSDLVVAVARAYDTHYLTDEIDVDFNTHQSHFNYQNPP